LLGGFVRQREEIMDTDVLVLELDGANNDANERDAAIRVLLSEVMSAQGINVLPQSDLAPANAKSFDSGTITALAVTLLSSHGLVALINVLRDWATRYRTFKIKVKRGASTVEISGVDPDNVGSLLPKLRALLEEEKSSKR
jgi:hypothetical protein